MHSPLAHELMSARENPCKWTTWIRQGFIVQRILEIFSSDSTHMAAPFAYRGVNLVCQTDCYAGLTRDFYCPKSAGEAKASLHRAQPRATDGPTPKLAL